VSRTFPYTGIATKEWWANILVWPRELWPRELGQLTDPIIAPSIKNTFYSILQNQNFFLLRFGIQELSYVGPPNPIFKMCKYDMHVEICEQ
jgi:hypothetical protein